MHLTVDLLRCADGRLEGIVITDSGRRHAFSGTLDLLRILEDLEPGPGAPGAEAWPGHTPGRSR